MDRQTPEPIAVDPAAAREVDRKLQKLVQEHVQGGGSTAPLAFRMLMTGALLATQVFGPTGAALMLRKAADLAEKQLRS
jgi:hypothetical protein